MFLSVCSYWKSDKQRCLLDLSAFLSVDGLIVPLCNMGNGDCAHRWKSKTELKQTRNTMAQGRYYDIYLGGHSACVSNQDDGNFGLALNNMP